MSTALDSLVVPVLPPKSVIKKRKKLASKKAGGGVDRDLPAHQRVKRGAAGSSGDAKRQAVAAAPNPPTEAQYHANFGQALANAEKRVRDKGFRTLAQWLVKQEELSDLDWAKLWKGLFYCYWMSDKAPVQHELAERMSSLLPMVKMPVSYFRAFFTCMQTEWHGLDNLRLDKYYDLVRCFMRRAFKWLASTHWEEQNCIAIRDVLENGPLKLVRSVPLALPLHVIDIFLSELWPTINKTTPSHALRWLLRPFLLVMSHPICDKAVHTRIHDEIITPLLSSKWIGEADEEDEEEEEAKSKGKRKRADEEEEEEEAEKKEKSPLSEKRKQEARLAIAADSYAIASDPVTKVQVKHRSWLYDFERQLDPSKQARPKDVVQTGVPAGEPVAVDKKKRKSGGLRRAQKAEKEAREAAAALEKKGLGGKKNKKKEDLARLAKKEARKEKKEKRAAEKAELSGRVAGHNNNKTVAAGVGKNKAAKDGGEHESKKIKTSHADHSHHHHSHSHSNGAEGNSARSKLLEIPAPVVEEKPDLSTPRKRLFVAAADANPAPKSGKRVVIDLRKSVSTQFDEAEPVDKITPVGPKGKKTPPSRIRGFPLYSPAALANIAAASSPPVSPAHPSQPLASPSRITSADVFSGDLEDSHNINGSAKKPASAKSEKIAKRLPTPAKQGLSEGLRRSARHSGA